MAHDCRRNLLDFVKDNTRRLEDPEDADEGRDDSEGEDHPVVGNWE